MIVKYLAMYLRMCVCSFMYLCCIFRRKKNDVPRYLFVICPKQQRRNQCRDSYAEADEFLHPELLLKGMSREVIFM